MRTKNLDETKILVEMFLQYNDNLPERRRFYQVLDNVLSITMNPDYDLQDYTTSLNRMYGNDLVTNAIDSVSGKVQFYGLTPTNSNLDGIDKHERLIQSYKKLHAARARFTYPK